MKKILLILTLAIIGFSSCIAGDEKAGSTPEGTTTSESSESSDELLTKDEFIEKVWNYEKTPSEWVFLGDKPVIIDFYADWCGPCKTASPILEEVAKQYEGQIEVYKIDTDNEQELASVFGISSIPSFLYIPLEGKPVMTSGIARTNEDTKNMFIDMINKYLITEK